MHLSLVGDNSEQHVILIGQTDLSNSERHVEESAIITQLYFLIPVLEATGVPLRDLETVIFRE